MSRINTVLFDLDGTLVDTAPDMGYALNALLQEYGREALPAAAIRPYVSHGARGLIYRGFGEEPDGDHFEEYRSRFLELYEKRVCVDSRLFDGMSGVIGVLDDRAVPWGIVTNKPHYLTRVLLDDLDLARRASCVVSGDTIPERKPHPAPLLHACRELNRTPDLCMYVGDAQRDIEAGTRAGMATLVALFGYLDEQDKPSQWGATGLIEEPAEILDWVS